MRITYPEHLPVAQRRDEILDALRADRVLVLTGETGSGKTTQLPKMLLELGCERIALTQPRRVAAVAMASRLREELAATEAEVAHAVRFDDRRQGEAAVTVMTDGLLLAEASRDRLFGRYDAVIVDEAHERSLDIDLLLGLLTLARRERPALRVIVSSASIAAERFAAYLEAPAIAVSGRTFPVEILHQPPGDDDVGYLDATVRWIRDLHAGDGGGDILAFLPTERDILEAERRLRDLPGLSPMPLFGRLTPHEQARIFAPAHGRKAVLATNIAETSLTIPGIRYVVDTGLARLKRFQPSTRTERLPIEPVSQASATQRAGRAGRIEAGICVRLYAEDDLVRRDAYTPPEVLRSNLAGVLLRCLAMDLGDAQAFPWLDAPAAHAWDQARVVLDELGALSPGEGPPRLTALGRALAAIPADPQVARILIAGLTEGVPHEACTIAAFLSVQDPRVRPLGDEAKADAAHRAVAHEAGDLATVLRLWDAWQQAETNSRRERLCRDGFLGRRRMREWADVRHQLWSGLRERQRGTLPAAHPAGAWPLDRVHRSVLAGMLGNVLMWDAKAQAYRAGGDRLLAIHPGSALRQRESPKSDTPKLPWLVACEVVETSRLFARLCAPIDPAWVVEMAGPRLRASHREPRWDARRGQVVVTETLLWRGLPVREGKAVPYGRIDPVAATAIFVREGLCGDEPPEVEPLPANRRTFAAARGLRDRLRDPSLAVEPEHLAAWYATRLAGAAVSTTAELRAWLAERTPEALRLALTDLVPEDAAERAEGLPDHVIVGLRRAPLAYRYALGSEDDGVTLTVDEAQAAQLTLPLLDHLVPAWRRDLVAALLEQLPKEARRRVIPLAGTARELAQALDPGCDLAAAVAAALERSHDLRGMRFDRRLLPAWLRPRVVVRGGGGVVWQGRDPEFLAAQAEAAPDRLALLKAEWETPPAAAWPGDCPAEVVLAGVRGHVALERSRAADGTVAVRRAVHAGPEAASAWHRDGLEAAVEAALAAELAAWVDAPGGPACDKALGLSLGAARRQLGCAAAWSAIDAPVRDDDAFARLLAAARARLADARRDEALLARAADAAGRLRARLKAGARNLAAAAAQRAVAVDLTRLLAQPWAVRLPWPTLARLDRLLAGLERRLDAAATGGAESARVEERVQRLASDCSLLHDPADARWHLALGLAPEARLLRGRQEECALALATPGAGAAAARGEAELRQAAVRLERAVEAARARLDAARARLAEARPLTGRIADPTRRTRLADELAAMHRLLPDLTIGADLAAQERAADALIARVRAALA